MSEELFDEFLENNKEYIKEPICFNPKTIMEGNLRSRSCKYQSLLMNNSLGHSDDFAFL